MSNTRVIRIEAKFLPHYRTVEKEVNTGETKKSLFGKEKPITETITEREEAGTSDSKVDGEHFRAELERAIADLVRDGYQIQSILPIESGSHHSESGTVDGVNNAGVGVVWGGYGYGYGFSYTESILVVGIKTDG
ncbi:MAG: hypothetical protein AAGA96_17455 [Verrucomicrobiota bacterium]